MSRGTRGAAGIGTKVMLGILATGFGAGAFHLGRLSVRRFISGDGVEGGMFALLALFAAAVPVAFLFLLPAVEEGDARMREMQRRRDLYPDEPWRGNPDWDSGSLEFSLEGGATGAMWGFAIFWNAVVVLAGYLFAAQYDLRREVGGTVMLAIMLAAGLFLTYLAIRVSVMRRKYGRSSFRLKSMPVFQGGRLEGSIVASTDLPGGANALLTLECESHTPMPKSDLRITLWSSEQQIVHPGGATIPVCFDVPEGQPESRFFREEKGAWINWRVSVRMEVPGVDYRAGFEVPVYRKREGGAIRTAMRPSAST
jgi:hypothetical protein